jgi:O-methyltransferase
MAAIHSLRTALSRARAARITTVFGLDLARSYPAFSRGFDHEAAATEDMLRVRPYTMTKYDRCAVLHNLVEHIERANVPGDFVECGVWRGGSMGLMALANLRYSQVRRHLHLLDAWGDWPDPTAKDGNRFQDLIGGVLKKADSSGAREACEALLEGEIKYPKSHIHYHQGLFENTLPKANIQQVALLRLDCDWYDPTTFCLETLYDCVAPGGAIILDDYGYCDGAKRATDDFLTKRQITPMLHFVDYTCRYLMKD